MWTAYFSSGFHSLVSASVLDVSRLNPSSQWCWPVSAALAVPAPSTFALTFVRWHFPVRRSFPFYLVYSMSTHSQISVLFKGYN